MTDISPVVQMRNYMSKQERHTCMRSSSYSIGKDLKLTWRDLGSKDWGNGKHSRENRTASVSGKNLSLPSHLFHWLLLKCPYVLLLEANVLFCSCYEHILLLHEAIEFQNYRDNVLYSSVFQTLHDDPLKDRKINLVGNDQQFLKSKI